MSCHNQTTSSTVIFGFLLSISLAWSEFRPHFAWAIHLFIQRVFHAHSAAEHLGCRMVPPRQAQNRPLPVFLPPHQTPPQGQQLPSSSSPRNLLWLPKAPTPRPPPPQSGLTWLQSSPLSQSTALCSLHPLFQPPPGHLVLRFPVDYRETVVCVFSV